MPSDQTTEPTENSRAFPRTQWGKLVVARDGDSAERYEALSFLMERYWKPVYCYICRCGQESELAKDLTQEFFTACLQKELFAEANKEKGRFRNFLLKCLNHFLANKHRAEEAKIRRPEGGFVSIHELATKERFVFEPVERETPDTVFHRVWVTNLIERVLLVLEQECRTTDKMKHYELFRQWIVLPILEGIEPPPLNVLAEEVGLSAKQASACIITARRAFQRLLREEILLYASTEAEVAVEIQDLFHFVANE